MTATHTVPDVDLVERDPRTVEAVRFGACGGGLRQPVGPSVRWARCRMPGVWWVSRGPARGAYEHVYCTRHAAARLRALDWLAAKARDAEHQRAMADPWIAEDTRAAREADAADREPAVRHG